MLSPYMKGLPELLLFGSSVIVMLIGAFKVSSLVRRLCVGAMLAASAAAAVWAGWYMPGNLPAGSAMFGVIAPDTFSFILKLAVILSAIIVVILVDDETDEAAFGSELAFLMMASVLGCVLLLGSTNLLMLFVAVELTSLPLYVMAGLRKTSPESGEAGFKYYVLGVLATGFLLYGISLIYGTTGSLDLAGMTESLKAVGAIGPAFWISVVFFLAGLGFKVAAVPFHSWAPDVYEGAPAPVLAFLTSAPKIAGFAVMLRFLTMGISKSAPDWALAAFVIAVTSMFVGNLIAIPQRSLRRMLAYSAIAHAGYMMLGVATGGSAAVRGVIGYVLIYAISNLGIFGLIYGLERAGLGDEMSDLAGLYKRQPLAAFILAVFLVSLAGLPPLAGFWAKLGVFYAAVQAGYYLVVIIAVINSVISLFYYANVFRIAYLLEPMDERRLRLPLSSLLVAGVSAGLLIGIGLYPQPLLALAGLAKLV